MRSIFPDRSESTRGTSLSQRYSKLSHEIEATGQPVQDGDQTLKIVQCSQRSDTNTYIHSLFCDAGQ